DLRLPLGKMMYAYHYQSLEGALVFRYDNTAHHKSISTFPLHKHLSDGGVTSSGIPSLEEVLMEIEEIIFQREE
ncbi:MAG: toxin-antitoxin system TumE family protein, partial [Chloroflexota bacterium]